MTADLKAKLDFLFTTAAPYLDYEGLSVTFIKNSPASDEAIAALPSNLDIPNDYIQFLKAFNGCTLFEYKDFGGFEFLAADQIERELTIQRETYAEDWDESLMVFCNVPGDGDFISFRNKGNNEYEILDCYHDDSPKNWNTITNSFDVFLERLIDEKGKRYWL
ncbi:MAG TPA: SMI1/KNR4 family protein [Ferruginibacter sp.]|nr:SMI1/KNR4 family protein [Ferruginibacter sp.]